jgi:hypothetical protein
VRQGRPAGPTIVEGAMQFASRYLLRCLNWCTAAHLSVSAVTLRGQIVLKLIGPCCYTLVGCTESLIH